LPPAWSAVGVPCRLVTDQVNARVVLATAAATGCDLPVDIAAMRDEHDGEGARLADIERAWRVGAAPISHVIAIERCGPSRDGRPRNADGADITAVNAPLDRLFTAGPWATIGIGDLGNELGMGSLPYELVAASVAHGGELWCRVTCDHPIVAGVSNLAAAALLGALALQRPGWSAALLDWLTPDCAGRLLAAAVRDGGAVASQRGRRAASAIGRGRIALGCARDRVRRDRAGLPARPRARLRRVGARVEDDHVAGR